MMAMEVVAGAPFTSVAALPARGRLRVGLLLPNLDGGGAELVVLRLAEGLRAHGVEVDLLLGSVEGEHCSKVPSDIRVVTLGERPLPVVSKTVGLVRYLRAVRPDILVASLDVVGASIVARDLARTGTAVVQWVHTNLDEQIPNTSGPIVGRLRFGAVRALYRRADAIVAVSEGVAASVARLAGLPPGRVSVVHNPVVTPRVLEMAREPIAHPWFAEGAPPVIVGVGRLVKQKNFPLLLRAFASVRSRRPVRLVLLGGPDEREPEVRPQLDALARELGITEDLAFLGFQENPFAFMARASAFVLSSIYEGLPTVLIEALAVGAPVVSVDCPSGPREILEGGRYGPLVPVHDVAALAEAINGVLTDPVPRSISQERGAQFSQERATAAYLDVLRSLSTSRRTPSLAG